MKLLRGILLTIGVLGIGAVYLHSALRLPHTGHYPGPYGDRINEITVGKRKITDAVTTVNFDTRAMDTLGEEFILFTSVLGAVILLKRVSDPKRREKEDRSVGRDVPPPSDAVAGWALRLIGPTVVLGLYFAGHGQISPGGGFQGGVILACAPVLLYLAESYEAFKRIAKKEVIEIGEAIGASAYAFIGLGGLIMGGTFLLNWLHMGVAGTIASGGMVLYISLAVGLEVAGGFVLVLTAFLEEMLASQEGGSDG